MRAGQHDGVAIQVMQPAFPMGVLTAMARFENLGLHLFSAHNRRVEIVQFKPKEYSDSADGRKQSLPPLHGLPELHRGLPNMHPGVHMRISAEIPNHRRPFNLPDIPNPIAPQIPVLVESHVQIIEAAFLD